MRCAIVFSALLVLVSCQMTGAPPTVHKVTEEQDLRGRQIQEPALQVAIPALAARARLLRSGRNGDVDTWSSRDGISLSFQQGVLVASRGLGHDLMGADAARTLVALAEGGAGIYRRKMRYLTGDYQSVWLAAGCSLQAAGGEGGLLRMEEHCRAGNLDFTNQFWLDRNDSIVRSRQWISPQLGYIDAYRTRP